ncbi:MaoC/PaaZ C-terminal domain-containing protein [Streptomyces sp. NPDC049590]|uniref:MaoC family dehydratase n=1 Tax=Streptomyces sp. NPDC049590 TaxID=3154834 RepID=UPI00343B3A17
MHTVTLAAPPALGPLLALGALRSPFRRPAPDAAVPPTRLVLPGVRVDLARLAAYERICGFPTGEPALPLTYPHVLGFPLAMRLMSGRDFPLPLLGLVHTSVEIERSAALPADGTYELSVWVEGLTARRRGTEAVVVTAVRSGGEVVWSSRSGYLTRTRAPETRERAATGAGRPDADAGRPDADAGRPDAGAGAANAGAGAGAGARAGTAETGWPGAGATGTDWPQTGATGAGWPGAGAAENGWPGAGATGAGGGVVAVPGAGEGFPSLPPLPPVAEWRLGADVGRRYGAVSGDRNPIHLYPLTARLFGFPRPVAHGMWTLARCLAAHGGPAATVVRARFRAPVPLPGTVTYGADGGGRFELRGADGRLCVAGSVTARRPR